MSWFLESWSVAEGCAFAVHRDYTQGAEGRMFLDPPDHVIYVCPPHFVPTPTGYATALAAARGRFQEKFVDGKKAEVAFDTLEQVIELVRRAYLAAGAGGAPPPDGAPRPNEPNPNQPIDESEAKDFDEAVRRLRTAHSAHERTDTAQFLSSIWTANTSQALNQFCEAVLEATIAEAPLRLKSGKAAGAAFPERDIRDFSLLSIEMNEWTSWADGAAFLSRTLHRLSAVLNGSDPYSAPQSSPVCWPMATTDGLSRALASGLLHRLPSPVVWQPYQQLTRLGDHLAAAMSDRAYLRSISSLNRALPLLTCALALAAAESYRFRSGGPFRDASSVRRRAFAWLAREVPDNQLDKVPMADTAIRQVLDAATSVTRRSTL